MGPEYNSSEKYILGSSQRLSSRLQRSARIGYCCSKCSERSEDHFFLLLNNCELKTFNIPFRGSDNFCVSTFIAKKDIVAQRFCT